MDIEYFRTPKKSYMIVKNADYAFENYELQMILHNEIPCLVTFQVIVGDGRVEYWYDVTGMQPLNKQFSVEAVKEKQLRFLLQNLMEMKNMMEEYLLDDRNICFTSELVYYDRFADKIRFCFIPGFSQQNSAGVRELFEEVLQHLDHSDLSAVRLGYDMYERSAQSDFMVEDCIECLTSCQQKKKGQISESYWQPGTGSSQISGDAWDDRADFCQKDADPIDRNQVEERECDFQELEFVQPEAEKKQGHRRKRKKDRRKRQIDYGDILEEEQQVFMAAEKSPLGFTECFFDQNPEVVWELVYKGDGAERDLRIDSFPYIVGTDRERTQGTLQARTVSRVHARISEKDNQLWLEDFNSTNGTYLNHKLIPMNTPVEIRPGDRVVFATEEFMVHSRPASCPS